MVASEQLSQLSSTSPRDFHRVALLKPQEKTGPMIIPLGYESNGEESSHPRLKLSRLELAPELSFTHPFSSPATVRSAEAACVFISFYSHRRQFAAAAAAATLHSQC